MSAEPFSDALKRRAKAMGIVPGELSSATMMSLSQISRLLTGARRPTVNSCRRIAAAFGVAATELVAGTDAEHLTDRLPSQLEPELCAALRSRDVARVDGRQQETLPLPRAAPGVPCPKCGRWVPAQQRFCGQCWFEPPPTGALLIARLAGFYAEGGHQRPDTRGPRTKVTT